MPKAASENTQLQVQMREESPVYTLRQLEHGVTHALYRPDDPPDPVIETSHLGWCVHVRRSPGHAVGFVMLYAGKEAWAKGADVIRKDVGELLKLFGPSIGWPTVLSPSADPDSFKHPRACWSLRTLSGDFRFVALLNDNLKITTNAVAFRPVTSLDPRIQSNTAAALSLLFPKIVDHAIDVIDKTPRTA